jgi:hypothetical protein
MSNFIRIIILIFVIGFIYYTYTHNNKTVKNNIQDYNLSGEKIQDNQLSPMIQTNNINLVKNGILNYDKSLTVGEAFDNWKACNKNTSWTSFQTDNKRKIVQFTCDAYVDHLDKHFIFQFTINKDKTFVLSYIGEEYIDTDGILSTKGSSEPNDITLRYIYENNIKFELK